jgi:hypothetical protein
MGFAHNAHNSNQPTNHALSPLELVEVELAFQHSITKVKRVRCMRVIATSIVAYMQECTACVCVCVCVLVCVVCM